ncbi:MAG TPA: hypothetical protein VHS29_13015 [Candidatus Acidoferrales bacterium]|jgi:hypothetical protein|nr:hypothetical protein [Candidatus Acidoferrales bacterium]
MASLGHGSVFRFKTEDVRLVVGSISGMVGTRHSPKKVELLNRQILKLSQTDVLQPFPKGDHFAAWEQPKPSPLHAELRSGRFNR